MGINLGNVTVSVKSDNSASTLPMTLQTMTPEVRQAFRSDFEGALSRFTPLGRAITLVNSLLEITNKPLKFAKPKKFPSINQLQQLVKKGRAPKSIDRFDKGNPNHNEDDHVRFDNGSALYRDGTWKHGFKNLTNSESQFLNNAGWILP